MLGTLARLALAPVVLLAKTQLDLAEEFLPAPDGPPRAHAPGLDPYRVLIVGDGVALGRGVRSHDLALPGHLARSASHRMGRGVDVDLITSAEFSLSDVVSAIRDSRPLRYDAIVLVAGSDEAILQVPVARWESRLASALAEIRRMVSPRAAVLVCGIPANHLGRKLPNAIARLADAHAHELDVASRRACARSAATQFVDLIPGRRSPGVSSPSAEQYRLWADALAERLASGRAGDHPSHPEDTGSDEQIRQAAVDRLRLDTEALDPALQRIVRTARLVFGTESALFTVLDRETQLHVARAGITMTQIPRSDSFCQYTIMESGGMIVEDALIDDRFRDNPLVTDDPHVRFYAGFPVDSPDGERLGALCVFDSNPRRAGEINLALLRELALLVQNELWRYLPVTAETTPRLKQIARPWTQRGSTLPHLDLRGSLDAVK